jgi:ATP-binding cassette, subfamily F, member 3
VLVDNGTAVEYAGSIEDYIDFVLGRNQPKQDRPPGLKKGDRKAAARSREEARQARKEVGEAEALVARLQAQVSGIDRAMFDPASADPVLGALTMGELSRRRAELAKELERAEERWLEATERLERENA